MGRQRLERDGCLGRRAHLPASSEAAAPGACPGPAGGRRGLALAAWLLVVPLGPDGMPDRLRRPGDAGWPEARGTLEAPGLPGLLAAPCGAWRAPGIGWA